MNFHPQEKTGFAVLALVILCSGCVHVPEPESVYIPGAAGTGAAAVIWSVGSRRNSFRGGTDRAIVTKINDTKIREDNPPRPRPIELLAGRYTVDIRYDREVFVSEFGIVPLKLSAKSVELVVEPGHSYSPQATRHCDKYWIWVEDWGERVQNDISQWRDKGYYNYDFQEKTGSKRIVAGEAPLATCDEKQ